VRIGRSVLVGAFFVAACGRSSDGHAVKPRHDARPAAALIDATDPEATLAERLAAKNPVTPVPPPTIKPAGKGDCRTDYAPRPERDPNPMCRVEGGTFLMGDEKDATTVKDFYIDKFEVTVQQAAVFINAQGTLWCGTEPCYQQMTSTLLEKRDDGLWLPRPGAERLAIRFSLSGARYYCEWAGKRLPEEAEWEYAARHDPRTGKDYAYAWGDKWLPRHAACDEELCRDGFRDDYEAMAPVGTFDGTAGFGDGTSPWGLHDTVGNVPELVDGCGPSSECIGCPDDPCLPLAKGLGLVGENARLARLTARAPLGHAGFRCARW
jgi:formylglycine-generating enzyme required for sulfatase activity